MKNITHTLTYARGTLDIGCKRFKHGVIRWHTLAYVEAKIILSMFKNCVVRLRKAYAEYLLISRERWSYADIRWKMRRA